MAKIIFTCLGLCLLATLATSAPSLKSSKISSALQSKLRAQTRVNIFVTLTQGTTNVLNELSIQTFFTRTERITAVYNALNAHAEKSQKNILDFLRQPKFFAVGIKIQSFWITNQVYVQGADSSLITSLATLEDVSSIDEEEILHLNEQPISPSKDSATLAEYNIQKVKAPEAWAAGFDGTGSVIGVIDTGARVTHEALQDSYRGSTHSWFNPYTQTAVPSDGNGHGTHVTGIIAGSQASGIGVAPGAKWISCKGLNDAGSGTQAALISCGQFMTCPHTYAGQNPDCAAAPHAVSNSWGPVSGFFQDVINTWRVANIVPIFAQGGSGFCTTITPPSGVIFVGATTADDGAASFSGGGSSGPGGKITPDICAPGATIRSASHLDDTSYVSFSGTSMAAPHVAGLVGLLRGNNPSADFTSIYNTITSTAERNLKFSGRTCDGIPDDQFPNHSFGWGRIDCLAAVQSTI